MAICKGCGREFQWGNCDGRWVLLEPQGSDAGMDRSYVDENGELRADHRDRCGSGPSINVTRLDRKQKAPVEDDAPIEGEAVIPAPELKRRRIFR